MKLVHRTLAVDESPTHQPPVYGVPTSYYSMWHILCPKKVVHQTYGDNFVTFGTARMGLGGGSARPGPSWLKDSKTLREPPPLKITVTLCAQLS